MSVLDVDLASGYKSGISKGFTPFPLENATLQSMKIYEITRISLVIMALTSV